MTYRRPRRPSWSTRSREAWTSWLSSRPSRSCWSWRSCRPSWPWKSWTSGDTRCAVRSWRSLLPCGTRSDNNGTAGWDTSSTSRAFRSCWTGFSGWTFGKGGIDYDITVNSKWPAFYRRHFRIHTLEWKSMHLDDSNFTEIYLNWYQHQQASIASDICSEPNTLRTYNLSYGGLHFLRIYASPVSMIYTVEPVLWWRHQMELFSALPALCVGNSSVTGEFPAQRPVTRSFDVFFDLRLNEQLSKQS